MFIWSLRIQLSKCDTMTEHRLKSWQLPHVWNRFKQINVYFISLKNVWTSGFPQCFLWNLCQEFGYWWLRFLSWSFGAGKWTRTTLCLKISLFSMINVLFGFPDYGSDFKMFQCSVRRDKIWLYLCVCNEKRTSRMNVFPPDIIKQAACLDFGQMLRNTSVLSLLFIRNVSYVSNTRISNLHSFLFVQCCSKRQGQAELQTASGNGQENCHLRSADL